PLLLLRRSVASSLRPSPGLPLFPYTTLFRSRRVARLDRREMNRAHRDRAQIEHGERHANQRRIQAQRVTTGLDHLDVLSRGLMRDRKSTRLNSSHGSISYAVFCLKKKTKYHL